MKAVTVQPLNPVLLSKLTKLREILLAWSSVGVAFSGGVDSTLLAWVAHDALGHSQAWAYHLHTPLHTEREFASARQVAFAAGFSLTVLLDDPLSTPEFADNHPERCYICKKRLYSLIFDAMRGRAPGTVLLDGTNFDDLSDDRPGLTAIRELGVRVPLAEAGFTKEDVRALALALGLSNWNLPSSSCLATRIPFGTAIVLADLQRVALLEEYLLRFGIDGHRVRLDGDRAVLELADADFPILAEKNTRDAVYGFFCSHGIRQIFLNLRPRKSVKFSKSTEIACSG